MHTIYEVLKVNINLIYFFYGLSFFMLGFAVFLKNTSNSNFRLANSLVFLAIFGVLHSFYEWGYIFIPIQEHYLSSIIIKEFYIFRGFIEGLSFVFLFYFGIHLLVNTKQKSNYLLFLPWIIFIIWMFLSVYFGFKSNLVYFNMWLKAADVWSRYLLALPGSFITCYALFLQINELQVLGNKKIVNNLYGLIGAIFLYGVVGGLVVPENIHLLSRYINVNTFFTTFKLPVQMFRAITGIGMAYFIVGILEMYDVEYHYKLEKLKKEKAILNERQRISRNLHDGIIQSIYGVGLGLESVSYLMQQKNLVKAEEELNKKMDNLNGIISNIRDYIMDLKPEILEEEHLYQLLKKLIDDFLDLDVQVNFDYMVSKDIKIFPEYLDNIYHILQEGLNNIKKHAKARKVTLKVSEDTNQIIIRLIDDGVGFDLYSTGDKKEKHQGLKNMKERANLINCELIINSAKGKGTEIKIKIPCEVIKGV
ncbi:sensor histidine kinase [Selenihalanaerobacter shriftii]|uniref:histidine kinase n=1 Tax=Selenihalanaerobacter shriftii TaxID=142842 RepID=A0A1T4NVZ5_9FIRM|nr:sensor histidine kinase [Selenihalanaerobacter shriftii]SJZ83365.1 Signal transduction histidine kinase [Selenihalanaerobacter shriftii]